MIRSDTLRRAVSLTLAVLCLLVVPQLAFAQFRSSKAPALTVGTVSLVAPTAVTGTYDCRVGLFLREGLDVEVTGFADAGQPKGTSYVATLTRDAHQRTTTSTTKSLSVSTGLLALDVGNTSYRLTIQAKLGSWTSGEYSKTITCGTWLPSSGSL